MSYLVTFLLGCATGVVILAVRRHVIRRFSSLCPECGPDVAVDEDGCCVTCGATSTGAWIAGRNRSYDAAYRDPVAWERLRAGRFG